MVMADRGFQINEELLLRFCSLQAPPGTRAKSQMTTDECKKTKDIANLRIHVERAINRINFFQILKEVIPVTMLYHVDDIVNLIEIIPVFFVFFLFFAFNHVNAKKDLN